MKSKLPEMTELANYYGYDLIDISDRYPYTERRGKTYGLYDRRQPKILACAYSTLPQIKQYLLSQVK